MQKSYRAIGSNSILCAWLWTAGFQLAGPGRDSVGDRLSRSRRACSCGQDHRYSGEAGVWWEGCTGWAIRGVTSGETGRPSSEIIKGIGAKLRSLEDNLCRQIYLYRKFRQGNATFIFSIKLFNLAHVLGEQQKSAHKIQFY